MCKPKEALAVASEEERGSIPRPIILKMVDKMDEERRLRVARLAMAESRNRREFELLGMANTCPLTSEQKIALDIRYANARADWYEALSALKDAVEPGSSAIELLRSTGRDYVSM